MRTNRLLLAALLLAPAAYAAEMTIYLQPNFQGKQVTLDGNTKNLADIGFTDQASSLVVRSGRWELCTQPEFRGDCVTMGPGEYQSLDQKLNHRIESARLVGGGDGQIARYSDRQGARYAANDGYRNERDRGPYDVGIKVFSRPGFRGRSEHIDYDVGYLGTRNMDDASSVIVMEGRWQVCTDSDYRGMCTTLGPGQYSDLGFGAGRGISSLRRVG
jgi:hypothetical protein